MVFNWMFIFCLVLRNDVWSLATEEPQCSRFHYEEQLLSKMIRTEIKFEELLKQMQTHLKETKDSLLSFKETIDIKNTEMDGKLSNFTKTVEYTNNKSLLEIKACQQEVKTMLNEVTKIKDLVKVPNIAFNSHTLNDRTLESDQIYIFTNTVYNYGKGYNNVTGIFTAPVEGMYLFTTSMCAPSKYYNAYAIVAKNSDVARSVMYGGEGGHPCNSLSTVVFLNVSDTVFVRSTYSATQVSEDALHRRSTFSGLLVHK